MMLLFLLLTVGGYTLKVKMMMMKPASLSEPGPASPACTAQKICKHHAHAHLIIQQIKSNSVHAHQQFILFLTFLIVWENVRPPQPVRPALWWMRDFRSWSGCLKRELRRQRRNLLTQTAQMTTASSPVRASVLLICHSHTHSWCTKQIWE